jgi:hypothetical protein
MANSADQPVRRAADRQGAYHIVFVGRMRAGGLPVQPRAGHQQRRAGERQEHPHDHQDGSSRRMVAEGARASPCPCRSRAARQEARRLMGRRVACRCQAVMCPVKSRTENSVRVKTVVRGVIDVP